MAELAQQIPWATSGWEDSDDFQDQLLGLLGMLCAVGEGMEADEEPWDGGSREWSREAKRRQKSRFKKEIKSTVVETKKRIQKGRSDYGTRQQGATGRIKGESGWRLNSPNKHAIN